MVPLLVKEVRAHRAFLFLVVFLCLLEPVSSLFSGFVDMMPLAATMRFTDDGGSLLLAALTLALTYGLLVGELDGGTIELLDALPVTRTRVFVAKIVVALGVLGAMPVLGVAGDLLLHALSRTSLDAGFHLRLCVTSVFIDLCQLFVLTCACVLLSFLRRFAWIVLAIGYRSFEMGRALHPGVALFDPFRLSPPELRGQRLVVPWKALSAQITLAFACLVIAWLLWNGAGLWVAAHLARMRGHLAGRLVMGAAGLGACILWVLVVSAALDDGDDAEGPRARYPTWTKSLAATEAYSITYPSQLETRALHLVARADAVHRTVQSFLDAPAAGRILVDAAPERPEPHIAGRAAWKAIRVDLPNLGAAMRERALAHETTHVYESLVSRQRMDQHFPSTRFFHEGLAQYVELCFFATAEEREASRRHAVLSRMRLRVDVTDLVDDDSLRRRFDPNLVYSMGMTFVATLVERHGDHAPARVLRAMGRDGAPKGLQGLDLWRDTFQAASFDFDEVAERFRADLESAGRSEAPLAAVLPRLTGQVVRRGRDVGVRPVPSQEPPWPMVCRFRTAPGDDVSEYAERYPDSSGVCWARPGMAAGGSIWYQLGLSDPEGPPLYEGWVQAPLVGPTEKRRP